VITNYTTEPFVMTENGFSHNILQERRQHTGSRSGEEENGLIVGWLWSASRYDWRKSGVVWQRNFVAEHDRSAKTVCDVSVCNS
jgi:hypothetical protein